MRRVSNAVVRASLVLSVVVVLAVPVQARPNDDGSWSGITRERIVKFLKKLGSVVSFGDMLADPRP